LETVIKETFNEAHSEVTMACLFPFFS